MKNMYFNLTQMLQGCSKRNGMTVSASNPDGEPTVNRQSRLMSLSGKKAEKEQLSPSCLLSASFPLSFRSRYLRYAAMFVAVLVMSIANIDMAWGDTSYYLFTPTSAPNPSHTGTLSGDFVCPGETSGSKTIDTYTFTHQVNFGSALGSGKLAGSTAGNKSVDYHVKTTSTTFRVYLYNNSGSTAYNLYYAKISEGSATVSETSISVAKSFSGYKEFTVSSTTNTTVAIYFDNTNIRIMQVIATESGTAHKQACEDGYTLSFYKGRIALKSDKTITAEGLSIKCENNFTYASSESLTFKKNNPSGNYLSFTTPAGGCKIKVTWSGSGQIAYNTSAAAASATNMTSGTEYALSGSTTYYVINSSSGSGASITKLEFKAAAAKAYTVTAVTSTGTNTYGTVSAGASSLDEGETTTITAVPASGYRVTNWAVSGTGASISPSGASNSTTTTLTMGTANATVTVTFGAIPTHTITYTNTKSMDNSANPTSYYEGVGVASFTKLRHAVGYDFTGWSPSSISSSATTNQTIDAQWTTRAAATGTGTLTYALTFGSGTITTSSITRNNGALYDATDVSLDHTSFADNATKNGCSGKLTTTSSKSATNYVELTFKIADGYTFTPTEVSVKANAVTTDKTLEVELKDNAATPNSKSVTGALAQGSTSGGATMILDFDASGEVALEGTVTAKIFVYGATDAWRLGTSVVITGTVASAAPACTDPDHVGISGSWRYFPGQTISLTATGYDGSDEEVEATGWQWQKEVSADNWSNLSNGTAAGVTISGATSSNLQISNCGTGNTGNYRCIVSTGATCSTTSDPFSVKIFTLNGAYDDGEFSSNNITFTSGTTGTATVHLAAGRVYKFKVTDNFGMWFGNSGRILEPAVNWDFSSGEDDNCVLFTGPEGDYTFTVDIDHVTYGTPEVVVSVAYPDVTHPSAGYAYFKNVDNWTNVGLYMWYEGGGSYTDWGSEPWVTRTTTICGNTYYYTPLPSWYNRAIFREVGGSGQTGNIEYANLAAYSGKYNDKSDANWHGFTTYTISFNAGGGEGTMSSITGICPDADQVLPANTFEKTGYTFAGWEDASGNEYDDEATIEDISDDITLTAQWEVAASQTALVINTLYKVPDMVPTGTVLPTSGDAFVSGLSDNTKFMLIGTAGADEASSSVPKVNANTSNNKTIDGITFSTGSMWFKGEATLSSNIPTTYGLSFIVPEGGGKLYLYFNNTGTSTNIKLAKSGSAGSKPTLTDGFAAVDVTAGTYYLYGTGTTAPYSFYGLKLCSKYNVSITPTNVTKTNGATGAGAAIHGRAYTATFTANTGYTLPSDVTVSIGGAAQTKGTGYTWTVSSGTGTLTVPAAKVTGAIVVTVSGVAAATYTVTYNAQGGSVTPASETVSTATLPTPTKSGYTFDGWYTSGGSKITGTYNPTADITLYAQWQEICVGSGEKDTIKIGVSSSTSYAASFTSSHKSTHTTASATAFTTGGSTTTSNSTYDKATAPYSVKFKPSSNINTDEWSDNYSVSASFSVASGYTFTPTRISATIVTEAADYTYRALLTDGVTTYTSSDVSSSANGKFTFSFSSLSGTALSGTITFKVQYKSTAKNTKYFVFNLPIEIDGIVTASGGGGGASCYYVTYNGNGATGGYTTDEAAYASGDNATAATNSFTKTGYTFGGWATSKANADAGTKDYDEGDAITISGNTTLYAIWQAAGYTLAWNTNGGSALAGVYSSGSIADGVAITAPTDPTLSNYTFNSWNTERDGTGSAYTGTMPAASTTYYAVWAQTVTLDANTANHGSLAGSATAILGRAGLTGITHATPASGYKLTGYYTAATEGTKVLNSDGTFASSNVTDYITDGKWSRTGEAPTLYAQYEASGSLKWNLGVKTDAESLTTSSKESSFTEISTSTMGNATVYGVTYTASSKNNLTGQISTPAEYDANKYVYVTFKVADGYKFTPSSISVKVQPVGENEHKAVKLSLADATNTLVSGSPTKCDGTSSGKTTTVTLAGDGTYFTGTVTLKIYVYADETASATTYNCYRLGTPIEIQGEVEAVCATMPSFTGLDYIQSSYTVGEEASAISIVGGENINTYAWKQNTTNDRSGGEDADDENGAINTPSYTPPTGAAGTMYYWCEMTNTACGIKIKSPAVAITVNASKSDATISWTGTSASANYGGGGYTVKATVNETGWNGNAEDLTLSAPAGIRIYNIVSGTEDSKKYVQASFDVTTAFDRETYSTTIPFTVSADATATYNAISDEHAVDFDACSGGEEGSAAIALTSAIHDEGSGNAPRYWFETIGVGRVFGLNYGKATLSTSSDATFSSAGYGYVASSTSQRWVFQPYVEGVTKIRIYIKSATNTLRVLSIGKNASWQDQSSKYSNIAVDTIIYSNDKTTGLDNNQKGYAEIQFSSALTKDNYYMFTMNSSSTYIYGVTLYSGSVGSGGSLATSLTFANTGPIAADASTANFQNIASKSGENSNTLGTITYSSNNDAATVNATTGEVSIHAKETAQAVTITATLSASGCYQGATATYTINVAADVCDEPSGSIELTSGSATKCSDKSVTLTMTGFTSGATVEWYNGDTKVNDASGYTIVTSGSTSTLTTSNVGTYSAIAKVTGGCASGAGRTNSITISNKSTSVHVTRLVKEWYIKNGRLTPDIALWQLGDDCSFVSVAASDGWDAGTDLTEEGIFYEKDGIVYMKGTEPKANYVAPQDYTLTLTVNDGCDSVEQTASGKLITIHHQQNTDKHVLAFIVSGTDKGDWTAGVTADQTTNVGLYNAIAANFDVLATNSRSTDDEQKLKEYYSQFDILCITDYPNTGDKGANKKSYVDALGALIDIRPILTMEAWVSKLANWKAKGLSGNPKSPSTRQYTMDLQCKDHEVFSGVTTTKVGEGDEAMYRVTMVDRTLAKYDSLDNAASPQTGNYPALQGYTFTEEMANDLLPIGLIDDGAGNPLQVGIERQRNMEARLMVLGINSYAMERLTDDGEQVVINALNYLMKKNAEDIADCSIYFTGGDADEDEATRYNWNVDSHWSNGTQPISTQKVRILAKCVIPSGAQVHVTDVLIVPDGPINHGADVASGSLTIEAGGALIVDGKVEETTAPNYFHPHGTSAENLVLKTSSSAQAALIFDNSDGETQATVNLYSLGRKEGNYQYQYFAVPMEVVPVNPTFANETHGGTGIYTYVYSEASSGWTRRGYYDDLYAFEGLGITTKSTGAMNYTMTGNLASTATKEITLTHADEGLNLIGNSWMAPIQIGALAEDNTDANITKTVYIYCAGRDAVKGEATSGDTETAGQWLAVPFEAAFFATWKEAGKLSVIPAMQAFEINVSAEATLTLDYDKVVRGSTNDLNAKLRAPGRRIAANEVTMTNIRVADSKTHTDLSLFEGDRFSEAFDNGWEAEYMDGDGRSAKLYAETEAGQMAVAAMYDYEGTVVGFAPGQETEYTFSFMGEDNGYYLNDIKLKNSVRISEGETYTFTYEEGDAANRFYISRTAINAPEVATGMENLDAAAPRVQKIIYNDKLYIIRGGRLYDATGKVVK